MKSKTFVAILAVLAMAIAPLWSVNAAADEATEPIVPTTAYEWEIINYGEDGAELARMNGKIALCNWGGDMVPSDESKGFSSLIRNVNGSEVIIFAKGGNEIHGIESWWGMCNGVDVNNTPFDESKGFSSLIRNVNGSDVIIFVEGGNEIHGIESWWGMCNAGELNQTALQNIDSILNLIRVSRDGEFHLDSGNWVIVILNKWSIEAEL